METLAFNLTSNVRRERLSNGRSYLVAPASMIVPGVLPGSKGPLFYSPEEIVKNAQAWNTMPIVVDHPVRNGVHVSARDPKVLAEQGIGQVFNVDFDGRLVGEAWFDEELTRNYDKKLEAAGRKTILPRLLANQPIELSTGLFTEDVPVQNGRCPKTGRPYTHNATDHKPDHLAVLPDKEGACSLRDGCGIGVNELTDNHIVKLPNGKYRLLSHEGKNLGTFDSHEAAAKHEGEVEYFKKHAANEGTEECECGGTCEDCKAKVTTNAGGRYGNPKSGNTGRFKGMNAGFGKGEVHEAAQRGRMVLSEDDHTRGKDAAQQASIGQNPASWVEDEDKWEKAKAAAEKGNYEGDQFYAVVTHIYKNMGGGIKANASTSEETDMQTRDQKIKHLTANCACWKGKDKLLANADLFTDADLDALVVEAGKGLALNQVLEAAGAPKDITVNAVPDFMKKKMMAKEEAEPEEEEMMAKKDPATCNTSKTTKPMTANEWKAQAPPEIRATLNAAERMLEQGVQALVRELVANVADPKVRQEKGARLYQRAKKEVDPIAYLEDLRSLIPTANSTPEPKEQPVPDFSGQGAPAYGYQAPAQQGELTYNEQQNLDLDAERSTYDPWAIKANEKKSKQTAGV